MIRQYQKEESLIVSPKSPSKRRTRDKRHTIRFDTELMNQVDFLANHLEIKKLEVLRLLVKTKIKADLNLWDVYLNTPKKFVDDVTTVTSSSSTKKDNNNLHKKKDVEDEEEAKKK